MSEVTRYDLTECVDTGDVDITPVPNNIEGRFVSYEDYLSLAVQLANADSKRRELEAENAGLKSISEDRRIFIMNGVQLGYIKVPTVETDPALETIRIAVSPQEPTPITDAFLAEVRAQGVEMFAKNAEGAEQGNGLMKAIARRAIKFAAQLRKGAAL